MLLSLPIERWFPHKRLQGVTSGPSPWVGEAPSPTPLDSCIQPLALPRKRLGISEPKAEDYRESNQIFPQLVRKVQSLNRRPTRNLYQR